MPQRIPLISLVWPCLLLLVPAQPQDFRYVPPEEPVFVIPQARVVPPGPRPSVTLTRVVVEGTLRDQVATTEMVVHLHNPSPVRQEAQLVVPVPEGSAVRGFRYKTPGGEPKAELLAKAEAQRIYHSLVSRARDPGLAEFIGYNLIRSSVFPVEAGSDQEVTLVYENLLETAGNRVDYVLPRSESLGYQVPWEINLALKCAQPISTVYSPSHAIRSERESAREYRIRLEEGRMEPGPFRLSYLLERDGLSGSLLAYPDPKVGGGYFLLLAGLPDTRDRERRPMLREITLVLDRSGSMAGEKLEQARKAAFQILSALESGETFNILAYNDTVEMLAERPLEKNPENLRKAEKYLGELTARSGTNIHDALVEALRQPPGGKRLPIVLFLTDGLPTVGQTSESAIREAVQKGNPHERRIFSFGVGHDVNTPLLERIARDTRARATFVHPREDVEVKVGDVFRRLDGPVFTDAHLHAQGAEVRDLLPRILPDLFEGDQLVVLGQYREEKPIRLQLAGKFLGKETRYEFTLQPDEATTRHSFVPRLWANRKVGYLMDEIRQSGADKNRPDSAPKTKELVDEIVRLSKEYGILTEYTAFLIREEDRVAGRARHSPADHSRLAREQIGRTPGGALQQDAMMLALPAARPAMAEREQMVRQLSEVRSGADAVQTEEALQAQKGATQVQRYGGVAGRAARPASAPALGGLYLHPATPAPETVPVRMAADRTFHLRDGRWVDSRILDDEEKMKPEKTIEFAGEEYMALAERLAGEGRAAILGLPGDILLQLDGKTILIKAPKEEKEG